MAQYRLRDTVEADQFLYLDGIDGVETCKRAAKLGLTTNGSTSKLWEIMTVNGWQIVEHNDWIVRKKGFGGGVKIFNNEEFNKRYIFAD